MPMHYFFSATPFIILFHFLFSVPVAKASTDEDDLFVAFVKNERNFAEFRMELEKQRALKKFYGKLEDDNNAFSISDQTNSFLIKMYMAHLGVMYLMRENWQCANSVKQIAKYHQTQCETFRKYLDILYEYLFRIYASGTEAAAKLPDVKPKFIVHNGKIGTLIEILAILSNISRFFFDQNSNTNDYEEPMLSNEGEMNYKSNVANANDGTLRNQFDQKLMQMLMNTAQNEATEMTALNRFERTVTSSGEKQPIKNPLFNAFGTFCEQFGQKHKQMKQNEAKEKAELKKEQQKINAMHVEVEAKEANLWYLPPAEQHKAFCENYKMRLPVMDKQMEQIYKEIAIENLYGGTNRMLGAYLPLQQQQGSYPRGGKGTLLVFTRRSDDSAVDVSAVDGSAEDISAEDVSAVKGRVKKITAETSSAELSSAEPYPAETSTAELTVQLPLDLMWKQFHPQGYTPNQMNFGGFTGGLPLTPYFQQQQYQRYQQIPFHTKAWFNPNIDRMMNRARRRLLPENVTTETESGTSLFNSVNGNSCVICCSASANFYNPPCGHIFMCDGCAVLTVLNKTTSTTKTHGVHVKLCMPKQLIGVKAEQNIKAKTQKRREEELRIQKTKLTAKKKPEIEEEDDAGEGGGGG
uniref:Uncharacterized protein n=1 Tax=Globodera rostochiensis TaxID=31243 RepID=A0A914HKA8_GLORO